MKAFSRKITPIPCLLGITHHFAKLLRRFKKFLRRFIFLKRRKNIEMEIADFMKSTIFAAANGSLFAEIKRESGVNPEQSRCCEFHNEAY